MLTSVPLSLAIGTLRKIHHFALNVQDLQRSRQFYGGILGLHELTGDEVPETLREMVSEGKVTNFVMSDGVVLDLFYAPDLSPPDPDPNREFTRAAHLAFDIDPRQFDQAVLVLQHHHVTIAHGPVSRPTGRGVYFYDPDGFLLEIRCDPLPDAVA